MREYRQRGSNPSCGLLLGGGPNHQVMAVKKLLLKKESDTMRAPGFCTDKVVASSVGVEEHLCRTAWSFNGAGAGCGAGAGAGVGGGLLPDADLNN